MDDTRSLWLFFPRELRALPADLAAIFVLVGLTNAAVFVPVLRDTPLRVVFGLLFLLFVPGYVTVAALFPETDQRTTDDDQSAADSRSDPGGIERLALSFGLSVMIVPLIGYVLQLGPLSISLTPIVVAMSGFVVAVAAVAAIRRWELPPEDRFAVPYRAWVAGLQSELLEPDTRADAALNVVLVASLLFALASAGYVIAASPHDEEYTSLSLLTENEYGDLVAAGYPTEFDAGESQELVVGIENHEGRTVEYTTVVAVQELEPGDEPIVERQEELDRLETQLEPEEAWYYRHAVEPTTTGDDLRIAWLLYLDDVPDDPSIENADESVYLEISVSE